MIIGYVISWWDAEISNWRWLVEDLTFSDHFGDACSWTAKKAQLIADRITYETGLDLKVSPNLSNERIKIPARD